MKILNYIRPSTADEAYELISSGGTVIGGGAWMKLMPKTFETGVDISGLGLDKIRETDGGIHIGSMVTLRALETNGCIQAFFDGVISDAAGRIMGIQVRNVATVGGTVANRFGFSDLLTPLLAAGANLQFHHHGSISLEDYLNAPFKDKDLLLEVVLPKDTGRGAYRNLKKTSTDFPVVNAAVTRVGNHYKVSVGARPGVAAVSKRAMAILNAGDGVTSETIEQAAAAMAEELKFGSNSRGSEAYRIEVAKTLLARCIREVTA